MPPRKCVNTQGSVIQNYFCAMLAIAGFSGCATEVPESPSMQAPSQSGTQTAPVVQVPQAPAAATRPLVLQAPKSDATNGKNSGSRSAVASVSVPAEPAGEGEAVGPNRKEVGSPLPTKSASESVVPDSRQDVMVNPKPTVDGTSGVASKDVPSASVPIPPVEPAPSVPADRSATNNPPAVVRPPGPIIIGEAATRPMPTIPNNVVTRETENQIRGLMTASPRPELPDLSRAKLPDDAAVRQAIAAIRGRWRQVGGDNKPDFVEGGYVENELIFASDGTLEITRAFDSPGGVRLTRKTVWSLLKPTEIALGREGQANAWRLIEKEVEITGANRQIIRISPATITLPRKIAIQITGSRMDLGGKTYEKAPNP